MLSVKGNKKLKATKNAKYLIWSLPCVETCPYRTPHCESSCYGRKAENQYDNAIESRYRNWNFSLTGEFVPYMIGMISRYLATPSYKKAKKVVVRIHEGGDFYSKEYYEKWVAIADHFKDNSKVVFVAYTKSVAFIDEKPENMVVRFSVWDDTNPMDIEKAAKLGLPIYSAVETFTTETEREKCHCENCSTCFKCFNAKFETLLCEIH